MVLDYLIKYCFGLFVIFVFGRFLQGVYNIMRKKIITVRNKLGDFLGNKLGRYNAHYIHMADIRKMFPDKKPSQILSFIFAICSIIDFADASSEFFSSSVIFIVDILSTPDGPRVTGRPIKISL